MFDLIENLRQKPDRVKKKIAFSISFSFCLVVFVVWLTVIYPDFKDKQKRKSASSISSSTPVDTLASVFTSSFSKINNQVKQAKQTIQEALSSSTPFYYQATGTVSDTDFTKSETPETPEENIDKIE